MEPATNQQRLKFLVTSGQATYSYDLPQDGTAIICPLTLGDGAYQFRVMQNTSGDNYVELLSATVPVALNSERAPFTMPNAYCNYTDTSACVKKARELTKDAQNQGDAVKDICQWMVDNVSCDYDKTSNLKQATGYVPNPDKTLTSKKGICFDYASLGAAMLRSVGIPTKYATAYATAYMPSSSMVPDSQPPWKARVLFQNTPSRWCILARHPDALSAPCAAWDASTTAKIVSLINCATLWSIRLRSCAL